MTTNSHNPDEGVQTDHRESVRAGISSILGLEQNSGLGYSFNALQIMARLSFAPEEWMGMTEYSDREIQIMALRDSRRNRARYGSSRLDVVDWRKALRRISRNRQGRSEIERMFIAERQRLGFEDKDQRNRMERMLGGNRQREDTMKLNG